MAEDLKLIELVASRLCHDLVGPVGAIVNGVELLGDGGGDPEVTALIGDSAKRASRRLQVYRVAYGSASNLASMRRLDESRRLMQSLCETQSNLTLDWPGADDAAEQATGRTMVKVTLLLGLIATEVMPRGGRIMVRHIIRPDARLGLRIAAEGTAARLPDDVVAAFAGIDLEAATPKAVPVVLARRLAAAAGGTLAVARNAIDGCEIHGELPAGA